MEPQIKTGHVAAATDYTKQIDEYLRPTVRTKCQF